MRQKTVGYLQKKIKTVLVAEFSFAILDVRNNEAVVLNVHVLYGVLELPKIICKLRYVDGIDFPGNRINIFHHIFK